MSKNIGISPLAPQSRFYKGPYGRIFPELAPWEPVSTSTGAVEELLHKIANSMVETPPSPDPRTPAQTDYYVRNEEKVVHEKSGSEIPCGYTYFGQFIDHDITYDPGSSLMRASDPHGVMNFRTPRLDLDSVYGGGPKISPYLYTVKHSRPGAEKFIVNTKKIKIPYREGFEFTVPDLPRNAEDVAIIVDPRNDDNAIVAQVQVLFMLAHNELVKTATIEADRREKAGGQADLQSPFEKARNTLRWFYQYIVWYDYLDRLTHPDIRKQALDLKPSVESNRTLGTQWELGYKNIYDWKNQPYMPVEFSMAAFRFGHSMIRSAYPTNIHAKFHLPAKFFMLFDVSTNTMNFNLQGGKAITYESAIQWDWFIGMETSKGDFPQTARKINTSLSWGTYNLPNEENLGKRLAYRNLLRGYQFRLPAGSAVAKKLGVKPLAIEPNYDSLWYYILKEAECNNGNQLGPVGSTIVCSTFAGLLAGDPNCFINQEPNWTPDKDSLLKDTLQRLAGKQDLQSLLAADMSTNPHLEDINIQANPELAKLGWSFAMLVRLSGIRYDAIGLKESSSA